MNIKANLLTKDFLENHYTKQNKSSCDIAKEFNVGASTVIKYLKKHNIKRREATEKAHQVLREKGHYKRDNSYLIKNNPAKTDKARKKISEAKQGKNNAMYGRRGKLSPAYKHGKSKLEKLEWGRYEWKNWRRKVFERDNYTCRICGNDKGGNLEAHHIKKRSLYPELKYDVDNGITLCKSYHESIYGKEEKYEKKFKKIIKHSLLPRPDLV